MTKHIITLTAILLMTAGCQNNVTCEELKELKCSIIDNEWVINYAEWRSTSDTMNTLTASAIRCRDSGMHDSALFYAEHAFKLSYKCHRYATISDSLYTLKKSKLCTQ